MRKRGQHESRYAVTQWDAAEVRLLRERLGMTQDELAGEIGVRQQTVSETWPDPDVVRVEPGETFVFVSGLGGRSIRDQKRCLPMEYPYGCNGEWASIYTRDQDAKPGALFITFHVDDDPRKAEGYFKNIEDEIIDRFNVFAK